MDFLKHRYIFLIVSTLIIIAGLTYGFTKGFKLDVDFKGGTNINVEIGEEFNNATIEEIVSNVTSQIPIVQKTTGGNNSVSITTGVISNEAVADITKGLKETYPNSLEPSTKNVQPSFGKELIKSAIIAIVASIIIILIYIWIRFKTLGITAAITAVMALVHDALVMIAIYALLGLPINSVFVAVMLTIIGYSINDTIIIYDRIRENKRKVTKQSDLKATINESISQTLNRTIMTSATTVIMILTVYVFAYLNNQTVLKEFSLPLTLGILVGTYSSIFVASSLWYIFESKGKKQKNKN